MTTPLDPAAAEAIRLRYLHVDASNAADVLDTLGLPDQGLAPSFLPYPATAGKLAGWAYTISGEQRPYPAVGGDPDKMRACAGLAPGQVSVWSGAGAGVCFFGELIAIGMKERGCTGALVDGGIRDVAWIGKQGFPVYARYRTPVQSIGRWKVTGAATPCRCPVRPSSTSPSRPVTSSSPTRTARSASRPRSPCRCWRRPSGSARERWRSAASSARGSRCRTRWRNSAPSEPRRGSRGDGLTPLPRGPGPP